MAKRKIMKKEALRILTAYFRSYGPLETNQELGIDKVWWTRKYFYFKVVWPFRDVYLVDRDTGAIDVQ